MLTSRFHNFGVGFRQSVLAKKQRVVARLKGFTCMMLIFLTWWRHQMETFSASLALCEGNPSVVGGIPSQRPVTWSFGVFFSLIWAWTNDWANNRNAGDLRRHRAHYDVIIMSVAHRRVQFNKHVSTLSHWVPSGRHKNTIYFFTYLSEYQCVSSRRMKLYFFLLFDCVRYCVFFRLGSHALGFSIQLFEMP